jgi:hypothetical protein
MSNTWPSFCFRFAESSSRHSLFRISRRRRIDFRRRGTIAHFFLIAPAASRQRRAHMLGDRGGHANRRTIFIKRHDNVARMQMQRRSALARRIAVNRVAQDGPAHGGAMDAKLVRAPSQRLEREPGELPRTLSDRLAPSICHQGGSDRTCLRRMPSHHRPFRHGGLPPGSCFIHQPRETSRRPSGSAISP